MSKRVEFFVDENVKNATYGSSRLVKKAKGITGWLIKNKLAKNVSSANIIMLLFSVALWGIMYFMFMQSPDITPETRPDLYDPAAFRVPLPPEVTQ